MVVVTRAQKRLLMAKNMADQEPQLQNPEPQDDSSDNESVISNGPDNTQDLSRLENQLKNEMGAIAAQVKETVLGLNQQMETKFTELDRQIHNLEIHLQDQNNNQSIGQSSRKCTVMQLNPNSNLTSNLPSALSSNSKESSASHAPVGSELHCSSSNNEISASQHTRADNFIKLKPQNFTGSDDDFYDFLTQFEITSEIDGWDYRSKSLYLANCLTGVARALLNELTAEQRRDYDSLVQKLTERYGSENRAEVFRSQLKSRVKGKGETTAQLAQAIRKLSRQAYPKVSLDVVEALAVDHFVDALPEAQIRLPLREVGPSTLAEAKKIAVRMEAHIKLNCDKCRLFQSTVSFLGHQVSEAGISIDAEKTKAVREWPVPRNVSELRSFIGLCSYMRKFINGFSSICKPLHVLTQKDQKFLWNDECQDAFEKLKVALTSTLVLGFPQESEGIFICDADASNDALGSVLSQVQNGQERVIGYYSKCFNKAERRYCTTRKELVAVVSSIKHWHHYLYGRHFKVRSDHGSLRCLMNFKICEGALA